MKAYTDIEQSRKLAEILPLESADMYYSWHDERYYIVNKDCPYPYSLKEKTPCWSLAALLELIPNWTMDKTDKINLTCNPYYHCEVCYENPVDAAFEMICWLKENDKL